MLVAAGGCDVAPQPVTIPPSGPITIAVAGDTVITRPLEARDPAVGVREIVERATLAFANLDLNVLEREPDPSTFRTSSPGEPFDGAQGRPAWPFALPDDAAALRAFGIDVVSLANDHATDYGAEGLESTRRLLDRAGILHVGAGPDLAAARAPRIIGHRVALIAVATSSAEASRASATRADIRGRPGLNPLRYTPDVTVDAKTFDTLRDAARDLGQGDAGGGAGGSRDALSLFGTVIKRGERTIVDFLVDPRDQRDILDEVRAASLTAEFVVVSVHSHEPNNASPAPAEFLRQFARAAIDAGADAVVGHGPHRLRGVEAYGGGVILYSLGNFIYQSADIPPEVVSPFEAGSDLFALALGGTAEAEDRAGRTGVPQPRSDGMIAVLELDAGRLRGVQLHPINGSSDEMLPELAELSRPFDTKLRRNQGPILVELARPD